MRGLPGYHQSAGTLGGSQCGVMHPVSDGRVGPFGSGHDERVLAGGEADTAYLGAGFVAERRSAGAWAHGVENSGHRKFAKPLALKDFPGHNKYMHTTVAQNTAHRTDVAWIKTAKAVKVNGENYISEYRNVFTGQAIRKDWRMTGCDWIIFDTDDKITGRAYSLTFAKYEAGE